MQNPVTEEGGDSILYLPEIFGLYEMSFCVQRHLAYIKEVIKVVCQNRGNLRHTPEELTVKPLRLADRNDMLWVKERKVSSNQEENIFQEYFAHKKCLLAKYR